MKIRNASPSDIPSMVELLAELFSIETDFTADPERQRAGLFKMLDGCLKHKCVKVVESDGQVVGMATIQTLISTAEGGVVGLVEDVVVKEAYRSIGMGRQLMCAIEDWAKERNILRLQLLADRENGPAFRFYQKIGWEETRLVCLRRRLI